MNRKSVRWLVFVFPVVALVAFVSAITMPVEAGPPFNCRWVLCAYPDCGRAITPKYPPASVVPSA
jgi:hypothetical protein